MTRIDNRLQSVGGLLLLAVLVVAVGLPLTASGQPPEKVTICHVDGPNGPETLEIAPSAVGSHLDQHEGDHLGVCVETPSTSTTVTTEATSTTVTTEATSTTVTTEATSTTVTTEPTSTTVTTAAAVSEPTTTTTVPFDQVGAATASGSDDDFAGDTADTASSTDPGDEDVAADALLPFTGFDDRLVAPALIVLLAGAFAVFVSNGFGHPAGAHVAVDAGRLGLGLHRGRHESADA